eukprot:292739-Rhodomonas_salina.1
MALRSSDCARSAGASPSLVFAAVSAPAANSISTISVDPLAAARCSAVRPSCIAKPVVALAWSSSCTASALPAAHATVSTVSFSMYRPAGALSACSTNQKFPASSSSIACSPATFPALAAACSMDHDVLGCSEVMMAGNTSRAARTISPLPLAPSKVNGPCWSSPGDGQKKVICASVSRRSTLCDTGYELGACGIWSTTRLNCSRSFWLMALLNAASSCLNLARNGAFPLGLYSEWLECCESESAENQRSNSSSSAMASVIDAMYLETKPDFTES